jgi:hemolysin D
VLPADLRYDSAVATQQNLYAAAVNGLNKEIAAKEAEIRSLAAQIEHSKIEQAKNEDLLKIAREKEARMSSVLDIVAHDEIDKLQNDILTYSDNIRQEEQKIEQLAHQQAQVREEIEKTRQDFRETHLKDLNDKEKTETELEAKLKELSFKNAKQMILSPVDGHVDQLFIHTVGAVVTPAEKLLSIVPAQTPLVVKALVENQDIGFVAAGQPVAIKVDTFEFQKYGMFEGKVKLISKDSHEDENKKEQGKLFDVYVTPTSKYLKVEGRNEPLKPGMTVSAEVKVGKRRIIEFFIYPLIKYWHEGMSVR